jgi:putative toxin-antitoxin system antitoxin component (TIGR02293 family)
MADTESRKAYSFVSLLGIREKDPIAVAKRVERGFSFGAFVRLRKETHFSMQDLARAASIKTRTLQRRKATGRFEPEESDRLLRVSRIFGKALQLFEGDSEAARRWLSTPLRSLAGRKPISLAKTEPGAREVEHLIDRLENGVLV